MSLVLERARQLAKALESCDEYTSYRKALDELEKHEAARLMWNDFQKRQADIQRAKLSGEDVPEDRLKDLERSYEILMMNPYVRDVLAAEFRFSHLFADVQGIIGEAVGLRYSDPEEQADDGEKPEPAEQPDGEDKSKEPTDDDDLKGPRRIIVPGRDI